ncbi:uncharacterized protein LOC133205442 [Saccostrea echinata]|uniref:uncharacterized protein LOC133205442 n=1 Tax=Saccostrea echinata TaxID=191078 RepID=UPI002A80B42A|nr:uncharacterized protein LOC133205442 [Saccostrea echinata]
MSALRKNGVGVFFIYDHTMLQKEEDDLKDAILYFYPPFVEENDQCAMCGQLMGMSEFLSTTLSKSPPCIFALKHGKYCLKRIGDYSLGLEGNQVDSNDQLKQQLDFLYDAFVLYCGSIVNIRNQYPGNHQGFLRELRGIWDILYPCGSWHDSFLTQAFQIQPSLNIPKGRGELFLQASHILQSSQRRPGVLVGLIMYKNRVLCTQASPELSRKLILVTPQLPCLSVNTGEDLPVGIRLVTIFLTNEEYSTVGLKRHAGNRHCKNSKFVWTTYSSESHQSTRTQSRGENSKRKEMEMIPEKLESISVSEKDKGYLSDTSVESKKSRNNSRKNSNLWTPADHPTQITQGFESPSDPATNVDNTSEQDVSISDLENESPKNKSKKAFKEVEFTNDEDCTQNNVINNILSSSNEDVKHINRKNMSSEVTILAEVHSTVETSIEESDANNSDIGIIINDFDVEQMKEITEKVPQDVTLLHSGDELPQCRTPEQLSDIDTIDSRLSGTESEIQTTADSHSSSEQLKERLEFPGGVSSGVGVSCDEMSDVVLDGRIPPSSVDSSIQSSKYSSFKSSQFDSLTSESTVQEEATWYPELDDLEDAILYVQGHSDISLLLLLESCSVPDYKIIQSLWKNALPQLADLDSSLKDVLSEELDESTLDGSSYLKYDSFFRSLSGNVLQPVASQEEEFQRLAASIHLAFKENQDVSDILFQSQSASCLGHKNESEEIYLTSLETDTRGLKTPSSHSSIDSSLQLSLSNSKVTFI